MLINPCFKRHHARHMMHFSQLTMPDRYFLSFLPSSLKYQNNPMPTQNFFWRISKFQNFSRMHIPRYKKYLPLKLQSPDYHFTDLWSALVLNLDPVITEVPVNAGYLLRVLVVLSDLIFSFCVIWALNSVIQNS